MTKAISYYDRVNSNKRSWSTISHRDGHKDGVVYTPDGIVFVWAEPGRLAWTFFRFCFRGKRYYRQYDVYFSDRGIVTKAKRFAREIVNAN